MTRTSRDRLKVPLNSGVLYLTPRPRSCLPSIKGGFSCSAKEPHAIRPTFLTMPQPEIILITGANTGIGFQIVRALCDSDRTYDIILGGRSLTKVHEAISSAVVEFPSSRSHLSPLQVDIEHDDSIKRAFDEIQSKFGRLDALVNNAGVHVPCHQ